MGAFELFIGVLAVIGIAGLAGEYRYRRCRTIGEKDNYDISVFVRRAASFGILASLILVYFP